MRYFNIGFSCIISFIQTVERYDAVVKVVSERTIEVYPDLSITDFLEKQLGSIFTVSGNTLWMALPRTRFYHHLLPPAMKIAEIEVTYGDYFDDSKYNINVSIYVYHARYLNDISNLARSYEEEFEAKKRSVADGFTRVLGSVTIQVTYEETVSTLKRKERN